MLSFIVVICKKVAKRVQMNTLVTYDLECQGHWKTDRDSGLDKVGRNVGSVC